jgi:hypothetical protein
VFSNKFILNFRLHSFSLVHLRCCAAMAGTPDTAWNDDYAGAVISSAVRARCFSITSASIDLAVRSDWVRRVHACCRACLAVLALVRALTLRQPATPCGFVSSTAILDRQPLAPRPRLGGLQVVHYSPSVPMYLLSSIFTLQV